MRVIKNNNEMLKEYVRKLSEDDLKFISIRLTQRLGSDVGEVVELLQKNSEVDKWLSTSNNAEEFFDMVDLVEQQIQSEIKRRVISEKK